jgi:hypothetical protein
VHAQHSHALTRHGGDPGEVRQYRTSRR